MGRVSAFIFCGREIVTEPTPSATWTSMNEGDVAIGVMLGARFFVLMTY